MQHREDKNLGVVGRFTGLWRHSDFVKLWSGQTISLFGSSITFLALPLTAILVLDASPTQMGVLTAVGAIPALVGGLFAGVWVDHLRRRPILIASDIGRAVLLATIPIVALLNILRIEHLYIVALLIGGLSLLFDVAYRAYLPLLIGREQLVDGNSKLELSRSAAEIAGPGLAGALVQLLTAPVAIAVDALTYLLSALFFGLIRMPEDNPQPHNQQTMWSGLQEGLRLVFGTGLLRAIAGCLGTASLFNAMLEAVFILYASRQLNVGPALLGIIFASGSIGFLIGALLPGYITRRFGLGWAMIGGIILIAMGDLLVPLAGGPIIIIVIMLVIAQLFFGLGFTIFNVAQVSLRQGVTPDNLQGRMNATMSVIVTGIIPIGALAGGVLGELIGLQLTLLVAVAGELLAVVWLLFSSVQSIREQPLTNNT